MQGICGTPPTLFTVAARLSSAVLSYERATPRLTIPPSPLRNDLSSSVVAPQRKRTIVSLILSKAVREGTNFFQVDSHCNNCRCLYHGGGW